MADEHPNPTTPPARLAPSEIAHLHHLGEIVRQSRTPATRQPAIREVLTLNRRHRDRGVPVTAIATALGVDVDTLFAWLLDTVPKSIPHSTAPPHRTPAHPTRTITPNIPEYRTSSERMISGSIDQTAAQSINATSPARDAINSTKNAAEPLTGLLTLLAVSGDPRPGGNVFGLEIAAIRTSLGITRVRVHELSCPDLAELGQHLRAGPTILHVAAHSAFGGVFLSLDGHPSSIGNESFAETIRTAPLPPKLIVLNICNSVVLGKQLADTGIPVLSWPTAVTDEQARQTAALFYRQLATRSTISESHSDVCRTINPRWPDLDLPQLHGTADIRPL